jgi:hypothetical protein
MSNGLSFLFQATKNQYKYTGELLCVPGANGLHHRRSEVDADAGSLIRGKDDRLCPPNIADFIR